MVSHSPVTPEIARAQILKKYERHAGKWAAHPTEQAQPVLSLPLHPPTERQALTDQQAAVDWTQGWAGQDHVDWGGRRWASIGNQQVPERLVLPAPADVARFAGRFRHWSTLSARFLRLMDNCGDGSDTFADALPRLTAEIVAMSEADFDRLLGVLEWLAEHPDSGLYMRQLPIRGVDSKWIGARRGLVERLHKAASGRDDLGLATRPDLVRIRFLDARLAPGGLTDVSAPLDELAALDISPATVFVFENLESVLAMPPIEDAVAIHGSGYAIDRIARLPWAGADEIIYWGDLDSHGFSILNRLRSHITDVRTVLMDLATLEEYQDLAVPEPYPTADELRHLRPEERVVAQELAVRGFLRIEQERLDWQHCVGVLRLAARQLPPSSHCGERSPC